MKSPRYWVVVLLLALTAVLLNLRSDADRIPRSEPLDQLSKKIGPWVGRDMPIDQQTIATLGKGDFLSRAYTGPVNIHPITLFIGYFPTQRTGQTIHSPRNCLPGAGWTFDSSSYVSILAADGKSYDVGEYLISNGDARQFVIYWYQAHGRSIANEYLAKAHLVVDAMRMNRTDGALVRVMTPIGRYESLAEAQDRSIRFTAQLAPLLTAFVPK
jgi:EpsI family protein